MVEIKINPEATMQSILRNPLVPNKKAHDPSDMILLVNHVW